MTNDKKYNSVEQSRAEQSRAEQSRAEPDFALLYDKEYYGKYLNANHFINNGKLSFRTITDGYVSPISKDNSAGVFDSEGRYVMSSSFSTEDGQTYGREAIDLRIDTSGAKYTSSTVVYIGDLIKLWGHFITDSARLTWFLISQEYRKHFADCPIVYLPIGGLEMKSNWGRMFEIFGIKVSLLTPITELTHFDRIILPDECFFTSQEGTRYFTHEYVEIADCLRNFALSHFKPGVPEKIYYSHSRVSSGSSGEDKLEKYFRSKGYAIIYPEEHTLDEQLNLLAGCSSFASTIGSCSHNMIFLRDNTEVILIPRANYLTGYQIAIDYVHEQNIHYIDSSFSFLAWKHPWSGPFLYCISSNLRKFLGDEDTESIIDNSDFWKYMRRAFGYRFNRSFGKVMQEINEKVFSYYAPVAAEYFSKLIEQSWPYRFRQFVKRLLGRGEKLKQ